MLSTNSYGNYYQPQFKAKLNMPAKEVFEKYAGKYCAEQVEIARPNIEKLAKEADIDLIELRPSCMPARESIIKTNICKPSIYLCASKMCDVAGNPHIEPKDARSSQSFADYLVKCVRDAIQGAEDGDWLT